MRRTLFAILSFIIFIIEISINLVMQIGIVIHNLYFVFLTCWVRYHNRIQFWTSRKNYFVIEEVNSET